MTILSTTLIALALIIATVVSYIFVVGPWIYAKELKELFSLDTLPKDKLEREMATPYLKAALQKYEYAMKAVQHELRLHLGLPDASTPEEVSERIAQYRAITSRLHDATWKHERARFMYSKFGEEPETPLTQSQGAVFDPNAID